MIDRREIIEINHEIDEELTSISDTDIMLNFSNALNALYPHLIPVVAFSYDSWDEIVEHLFFYMVYETFSYKYGVSLNYEDSHTYNYTLNNYRRINHIECRPKQVPIKILINGNWRTFEQEDLINKSMVFKAFGDGKHSPSGGLSKNEASRVRFNLVEVDFVEAETGHPIGDSLGDQCLVNKEDIYFDFICETYNQEYREKRIIVHNWLNNA